MVTAALIALVLLAIPLVSASDAGCPAGWRRCGPDRRVVPSRLQLLLAAALLLIPVSEFAIALVQREVNLFARPERLPRLELLGGVPDDARTMVVIPTLITTVEGVAHLIDHLEVVAIANRDPHIHFAILSDFADAEAAGRPRR